MQNESKICFHLRGVKSSYLLNVVPSQRRVITRSHIKHNVYKKNIWAFLR